MSDCVAELTAIAFYSVPLSIAIGRRTPEGGVNDTSLSHPSDESSDESFRLCHAVSSHESSDESSDESDEMSHEPLDRFLQLDDFSHWVAVDERFSLPDPQRPVDRNGQTKDPE